MKIGLLISGLISLGFCACATHQFDSVTIFSIEGRVLDQATNFPLQEAKVYFIDTGYDDTLSSKPTPIEIAQSNSRGKIEARFNYWWAQKRSVFDHRPEPSFVIVLSRELYETQRFHFKQSALDTDGITYLIDLADVYLVRKNE